MFLIGCDTERRPRVHCIAQYHQFTMHSHAALYKSYMPCLSSLLDTRLGAQLPVVSYRAGSGVFMDSNPLILYPYPLICISACVALKKTLFLASSKHAEAFPSREHHSRQSYRRPFSGSIRPHHRLAVT